MKTLKLLLLVLLALASAGVEASAIFPTHTNVVTTVPPVSAPSFLPIGSLEKAMTYSTNWVNKISVFAYFEGTEGGAFGADFVYEGRLWQQYNNGMSVYYDHSEPLGTVLKRTMQAFLDEGLEKGFFVNKDPWDLTDIWPVPPEEQRFLAVMGCSDGENLYIVDDKKYRGTGTPLESYQPFRLAKRYDGIYVIPDEASDPVITPYRYKAHMIHMPGIQDIQIILRNEEGQLLRHIIAAKQYPYWPDDLAIHPSQNVRFPAKFAFGQYPGEVILFYENGLEATYDLRTGAKIGDSFPTRLRLTQENGEKILYVDGGQGSLYIDGSPDMIRWRTIHAVTDVYTGYEKISALEYGPMLFFRARAGDPRLVGLHWLE